MYINFLDRFWTLWKFFCYPWCSMNISWLLTVFSPLPKRKRERVFFLIHFQIPLVSQDGSSFEAVFKATGIRSQYFMQQEIHYALGGKLKCGNFVVMSLILKACTWRDLVAPFFSSWRLFSVSYFFCSVSLIAPKAGEPSLWNSVVYRASRRQRFTL